MEDHIRELIEQFGPYEIVFENSKGDHIYAYLGTEVELTVHIVRANQLYISGIIYALEYDSDGECLVSAEGYKPIPNYREVKVYEFKDSYIMYSDDCAFYASDMRLYDIADHIRDLYDPRISDPPSISVEKLIEISRLNPDEYDCDYGYLIWFKDEEIIHSIPSMSVEIRRKYMLRGEGVCKYVLDMLPLHKDIEMKNTALGIFFVANNRILLITENKRCSHQCNTKPCYAVYPIADDPYIPYISAKDAINYIGSEYRTSTRYTHHIHNLEKELGKFLKLKYPYSELKDGVIPYGLVRDDSIDIRVQYHFSMLKAGHPYFMSGTAIDERVIMMADKCGFKYKRVKYPIEISHHGELLKMHHTEDIPLSLLRKCRVVREHEGGCCSQRHCEGYDLEIDALVPVQQSCEVHKVLRIPQSFHDLIVVIK